MDIPKLIAAQRAYFETGATRDIAVRRRALQALQNLQQTNYQIFSCQRNKHNQYSK